MVGGWANCDPLTSPVPLYPTRAMIRSGHDFWATLSTGEWAVIVQDDSKGFTMPHQSIVIRQQDHHTKDYLDTVIHESCHASRSDLTEKEVESLAADIAEVLWKRGYRLPKPRKARKAKP